MPDSFSSSVTGARGRGGFCSSSLTSRVLEYDDETGKMGTTSKYVSLQSSRESEDNITWESHGGHLGSAVLDF